MRRTSREAKLIRDIAAALHAESKHFHAEEVGDFLDVRLQLFGDDSWAIHTGDAQYDTDHRGDWADDFLVENISFPEALSLAAEMLDMALDSRAVNRQG